MPLFTYQYGRCIFSLVHLGKYTTLIVVCQAVANCNDCTFGRDSLKYSRAKANAWSALALKVASVSVCSTRSSRAARTNRKFIIIQPLTSAKFHVAWCSRFSNVPCLCNALVFIQK